MLENGERLTPIQSKTPKITKSLTAFIEYRFIFLFYNLP